VNRNWGEGGEVLEGTGFPSQGTEYRVPLTFPYRGLSETALPKAGGYTGMLSQRLVLSAMMAMLLVLVLLLLLLLLLPWEKGTSGQQ
jgi:hypothetical protein